MRVEGRQDERIREVVFTGDVFVTPPRTIMDLEAYLRRKKLTNIENEIDRFFDKTEVSMISLAPSEFIEALTGAVS